MSYDEVDINILTRGLVEDGDGVWHGHENDQVSYPSDGCKSAFAFEETSFWFLHRNRVIVDAIRRTAPPPRLFLDVGGGNGFVTCALVRAGYPSVILEPSAAGAANARTRGLTHVIRSDFRTCLFQPGRFEIVGLFDVIEHVKEDIDFLRGVASILRPGGLVVVTVPAFQGLFSPDDTAAGHFRRYTRAAIAAVLRAAGFQPVRLSYFMAATVLPVLLLRTVPGWLGLRTGMDRARDCREHSGRSPLHRAATAILHAEANVLARGGSIPMGTSCLAIGQLPLDRGGGQ